MSRDLFARAALADIPKILTLTDRNPLSPTYGCGDRNYWQYKIVDFPSGMAQEFVYPLALAWSTDCPDNPYHRQEAVRDWVEAGIRFAARSAHSDGACDDYFPYEKAAGAAAFSLLAGLEAYRLLGLDDAGLVAFFERRGRWLAEHKESGRLSNHEALIALDLVLLGRLTGDAAWHRAADERLARLLSWQHEEGWFQEYEGCDPGYLTLTIGALATLQSLAPRDAVADALRRAVAFASDFVHPDGSYGGEYGSRNTYNFFPHGFELTAAVAPEAPAVNDRFLAGLAAGRGPCYADDHIVGHHAWSYLLAWRHFVAERPPSPPPPSGRRHYAGAGLVVDRRDDTVLYLALNKGGVFKLFRDGRLVASDTQVALRRDDGRTAVAHMVGDYRVEVADDRIEIAGEMAWAKQALMTPFKLIVLRLVMLAGGRFFPDLVRALLQRLLITGRAVAPYRFRRRLQWREGRWQVRDEITADDWSNVTDIGIAPDQTSIHVVMSRTYQVGQLQRWRDLTDRAAGLGPGASLVCERVL